MELLATPEMLPYRAAYDAYAGISHVPEDRAKQAQASFAEYMNAFQVEMMEICTNEEQKAALPAMLERYRDGYLKKKLVHFAAKSRVMSSMITGPANFPVARMEKRSRSEHNRMEELIAWDKTSRYAVRRDILLLTPEEKARVAAIPESKEFMTGPGYAVIENYGVDRLQILFDEKPDEEMRTKLKAAAWKWAPSQSAWQRQLTDNAKRSARAVLNTAA